ncbi:MAG: glutamate racemase [Verrucomicrobiales bacterium]
MNTHSPIGIFDSGLGGLSVAREVHQLLPGEDLLYIADSAWCPYGGRPLSEIRERAHFLTESLLAAGAKLIVVACNTATIAAVESLRATYPIGFVGMEPAVKPAVAATRTGVVGVLATGAALSGEKFHQLVARHADGVRVITQPCPGLVEKVETGDLDGDETATLVRRYANPLLEAGADTLVLGCTHYPLLRPLIQSIVGLGVQLIDTGAAVARQVGRMLEKEGLARTESNHKGTLRVRTTGDAASLARVFPKLWPGPKMESW